MRLAVTALGLAFALATSSAAHAESLSFGKALKLAKQRAPELKEAQARIAGSDARVSVAKAGRLPSLGATFQATEAASATGGLQQRSAPPAPPVVVSDPGTLTTLTALAQIRWTLYDFGRTGNQVSAAEALLAAANASGVDAEAQLVDTVSTAYLDVVYSEKIRDIQKSIVDDREKSLAVVKALVKQGLSPAVDELRSRSRIEASRRDYETAEANLVEARVGLVAFLGLDAKSEPAFTAPKIPRTKMSTDAAVKDAEDKRPGIVSAKASRDSAESQVDAARSQYYPSVDIGASGNYTYRKPDTPDFWLPNKGIQAQLTLTVPIWDFANSPRVDAARADADRANANLESQVRDARTDGARAVLTLETSDRVLDHAKKASEASAAVLAVMRARFAQGLSSMIDLIDAESTDSEARIAEVQAERGVDAALLRLYVVTGRFQRIYDIP